MARVAALIGAHIIPRTLAAIIPHTRENTILAASITRLIPADIIPLIEAGP